MLCVLWICTTVILPAWFGVLWVPRLLLSGLLVLAVTDSDSRWHWCAPIVGLVFDLSAGALPGTYMIGFSIIYMLTRMSFSRVVPSDKTLPALGVVFVLSTLFLGVWVSVGGVVATALGHAVIPTNIWHILTTEAVRTGIGAVLTVGIYLVWLEFLHMFSRPIRLRRT